MATIDLGRIVRRHRRALAAGLAGASVLLLGLALRPAAPALTPVVVAARDLAAGHRLTDADLAPDRALAGLLPPGTTADPGALAGRVLAAPVGQGEPISGLRLVGDGGGWRTAPGMSAVPVRSADPGAAALLAAGQRVDLLAAPPMGDGLAGAGPPMSARPVADDVLVLAVVLPADGSGLLAPGGDGGDPLVVVEATPAQARDILGARSAGGLWFTLR